MDLADEPELCQAIAQKPRPVLSIHCGGGCIVRSGSNIVPEITFGVHPTTLFFSHHLTPSEWKYDIGNKELLSAK